MPLLSIPAALILSLALSNPCVDINTAPKEYLEKIKHIGEARAEQIIKLRQEKLFSSLDEMDIVSGIGPSRIADIKKQGLACLFDDAPAKPSLTADSLPKPAPALEPLAEIKPRKSFYSPILFLAAL